MWWAAPSKGWHTTSRAARDTAARLLEGTPESEASAQEPASRPLPRCCRRLRRPGPHGVRLGRQHRRHRAAAAKPAAAGNIKCDDAKGKLLASGSSAQKNAMDAWVKNYQAACSGVRDQLQARRLRRRHHRVHCRAPRAFAGSDSALKPEEVDGLQEDLQGRPGHQPARWSAARSPSATTSPAWTTWSSTPTRSPRSSTARSRSGTTRRSQKLNPGAKLPGHRDPGLPPLGRVRHHARTSPSTSSEAAAEAPGRTSPTRPGRPRAASPPPAPPASPRRSSRPRARSATSSCPTPRPTAITTVKVDTGAAAPGRGHRRERLQGHRRRQGRRHRQGPGAGARLHDQGRGRLPDHPGHVRDRLRQGQQGRHPARHQVLPDLHRQRGRPEGPRRRSATPRSPPRSSPRSARPSPAPDLT